MNTDAVLETWFPKSLYIVKDLHIDKLEIGQSETVWVDITGDCSISIDYFSNGLKKEELVAGYLSGGMGQKMEHNISGHN